MPGHHPIPGETAGEAVPFRLYDKERARLAMRRLTLIKQAAAARFIALATDADRMADRAPVEGSVMNAIGNRPFDAIQVGDVDRLVHTLTPEDFSLLATQAATMGAGLVDPGVAASRSFSIDAGRPAGPPRCSTR